MLVKQWSGRRLTTLCRSFTAPSDTCNSLGDDLVGASDPLINHSFHHKLSAIKTKDQLLKTYQITPPIKPWPKKTLSPRRLVSMINTQNNLDLALQIFHHAAQYHPNFTHTSETYEAMIQKLCRARDFEAVETLLTQLRRSNISCSEDLFIFVIRQYGSAGKLKLALQTFLLMNKEFRVQISVRTFHTLLSALIQNKEFDMVCILFKDCRKKFGIVPNVFTCNFLIEALCSKGDVEGAIRILNESPGMGMVPSVVAYATVLGYFIEKGNMIGAKRVFDEILDKGWLPDATTYIIMMNGFVKIGRLGDAVKMMDKMKENGIKPNEVTYEVMIEGFCKEKKSDEATNLLNDMLEKKCIPSTPLCSKLIDLLCEQGKVQDACNLWKILLIKKVTPDNAVLNTLICWLCKEGKFQEARSLFNAFERSYVPSLLTYNTLIADMCENGELTEAGKLWDDMVEKGRKANVFTYNMLIKGMCKGGNAKGSVRILEEMLNKGCSPNKLTSSILIKELCDSGYEADLQRVLYLVTSKEKGTGTDCWADAVTEFISDVENPGVVLDGVLMENTI